MSERISPKQFHEAEGIEDWRVLGEGACAFFRTGSFADGARLVKAISDLADLDTHHPDVDVRFEGVMRPADAAPILKRLAERQQAAADAVARTLTTAPEPPVHRLSQVFDSVSCARWAWTSSLVRSRPRSSTWPGRPASPRPSASCAI